MSPELSLALTWLVRALLAGTVMSVIGGIVLLLGSQFSEESRSYEDPITIAPSGAMDREESDADAPG